MTILRFSMPAVLTMGLMVFGCDKSDKAPTADAAGSAAAPTPPPAAAPALAAAATPAGDTTSVVPGATLAMIDLPAPKGLPQNGNWSQAMPIQDGDRFENYFVGKTQLVSIIFMDCNR